MEKKLIVKKNIQIVMKNIDRVEQRTQTQLKKYGYSAKKKLNKKDIGK